MNLSSPANLPAPFKTCPMCAHEWMTIEQLVRDGSLRVNGYQAVIGAPVEGLFFLSHECPNCHSTLALPVLDFQDWNVGSRSTRLNARQAGCPGHCLNRDDLEPCTEDCCMRWVRDVLQYLKRHELPTAP